MRVLFIFGKSAALVLLVALTSLGALAQQEIDPDHFDSSDTKPMPRPRTVNKKVGAIRYRGKFYLPNSAVCNGTELTPGKYSISLRSNGEVGQVTFTQKDQIIEIDAVVRANGLKHDDGGVIVENNEEGRTLSVIRIRGFDFVFDPQRSSALSQDARRKRAERLPLATIAPRETQVARQSSSKQ